MDMAVIEGPAAWRGSEGHSRQRRGRPLRLPVDQEAEDRHVTGLQLLALGHAPGVKAHAPW